MYLNLNYEFVWSACISQNLVRKTETTLDIQQRELIIGVA